MFIEAITEACHEYVAGDDTVYSEAEILKNALIALAPSRAEFIRQTGEIISGTIDYILDGESSLDDLEGCEKTVFGTKFEKRFIRANNLPRKVSKKNNPHNLILDTRLLGRDLDIKCTLGGKNWMIPQEAIGHWCFLVKVDYRAANFCLGLIKADPETLSPGKNRDTKGSLSKEGREQITWIVQKAALPGGAR